MKVYPRNDHETPDKHEKRSRKIPESSENECNSFSRNDAEEGQENNVSAGFPGRKKVLICAHV
jgi:hypothetical protein